MTGRPTIKSMLSTANQEPGRHKEEGPPLLSPGIPAPGSRASFQTRNRVSLSDPGPGPGTQPTPQPSQTTQVLSPASGGLGRQALNDLVPGQSGQRHSAVFHVRPQNGLSVPKGDTHL